MSPNATVQHHAEHLPPTQHSLASPPTEQPVERTAQPVRLQALFEGAASGAPVLGREGSPTSTGGRAVRLQSAFRCSSAVRFLLVMFA